MRKLILSLVLAMSSHSAIGQELNPPRMVILSPFNGSTVSGVVDVVLEASDDSGISNFYFSVDATSDAVTRSPYWRMDTRQWENGPHRLFVWAFDIYGNSTSQAIDLVFNNPPDVEPPTLTIYYPTAATLLGSSLQISLSAFDDVSGVAYIDVSIKQARDMRTVPAASAKILYRTRLYASPYTSTVNTSRWKRGYYYLEATATDHSGKQTTKSVFVEKR